ncbi:EFR1 family ferrodoxin [Desulfosporosinus sp. BG]|uniref:EFR1 family ferrodoxin n=1 Tax=Desulfosporosinus sp. BG TaxID=1633135 RepID=UPI0008569A8C|nr:EFR1 family ferrodoxin [Desulfosporosinus sp. BG]ODA41889.1 Ferredoxin [Desulfosporosinus sp. BG]
MDIQKQAVNSEAVGLIFPVHIWGVPKRVLSFLDKLKSISPRYIFALANNAGQVSNTLVQLKKEMAFRNLTLSSGWSIIMPSNYIPWGGPGSQDKQNERFQVAELKLTTITEKVQSRIEMPVEKGPLWQRIVFTCLYKLSLPYVHKMDAKFWTDEKCNHCGVCVNICPAQNIDIQYEKLTWHNHCEQCLACIQWCPKESLQYGKKTPVYPRYHHPEIKLRDLMN